MKTSLQDWIPRDQLMAFLALKNTQFSHFIKANKIPFAQIGRRKFFYLPAVLLLLEKSLE